MGHVNAELLSGERYRSFPGVLCDSFTAHIQANKRPEDFPGLCIGPIPRHTPYEIISKFHIDAKHRLDGTRVPCAMCQPNKFLQGAFIWCETLERIAIIGHCCAEEGVTKAAVSRLRRRHDEAFYEDYLLENLVKVKALIALVESNRASATEAQNARRLFKKAFPDIFLALKRAKAGDGSYWVQGERKPKSAAIGSKRIGSADTADLIRLGSIPGLPMLQVTFDPFTRLSRTYERLLGLGCPNDGLEALEVVSQMSFADKEYAHSVLDSTGDELRKAERMVVAVQEFFSLKHLALMAEWLNSASFGWKIQANVTGETLQVRGTKVGDFQRVSIDLQKLHSWQASPRKEA